jgi:hypothetical protein
MSQNTVVIIDGTGLEVLGYLNDAFNTLITNNSGSSAPTITYAHMLWADTTTGLLKLRNAGNTDWLVIGTISKQNGSQIVPSGTTAQRDASPTAGYFRFNTNTTKFEGYNGSAWGSVGGGATGAGSDEVFIENQQTVNNSYTISTNKNAGSFGPIAIADGVTVTIPNGSTWSIV